MCRCGIPSGSDGTSSGGFHPVVVLLDVVASRRQSISFAPFRSIGSSKRTRFPTGGIVRSTGSRSDVEDLDEDDETDCVEREQRDDPDGHPLSSPREGVQGVATRNRGGSIRVRRTARRGAERSRSFADQPRFGLCPPTVTRERTTGSRQEATTPCSGHSTKNAGPKPANPGILNENPCDARVLSVGLAGFEPATS